MALLWTAETSIICFAAHVPLHCNHVTRIRISCHTGEAASGQTFRQHLREAESESRAASATDQRGQHCRAPGKERGGGGIKVMRITVIY
jgi:hypothetical protein